MRLKMGTIWVVEQRKDLTEKGVEGKENWRNKYTPTNKPELKDREG